jgi:hypothetical protein
MTNWLLIGGIHVLQTYLVSYDFQANYTLVKVYLIQKMCDKSTFWMPQFKAKIMGVVLKQQIVYLFSRYYITLYRDFL